MWLAGYTQHEVGQLSKLTPIKKLPAAFQESSSVSRLATFIPSPILHTVVHNTEGTQSADWRLILHLSREFDRAASTVSSLRTPTNFVSRFLFLPTINYM